MSQVIRSVNAVLILLAILISLSPLSLCPTAAIALRPAPHPLPVQAPLPLRLPHDVDRLPNGHTLIADGGQPGSIAGAALQPGSGSQIIEVDTVGNCVWSFAQGLNFAHNADVLPSGHILISDTGHDRVIEIDVTGNVVWDSDTITLSDGSSLNYPNDVNWLAGDHLLITDRDNHRVLEIDRTGTVVWQFGVTGVAGDATGYLDGPHNADRLTSGNTIIADSQNNRILEVAPNGSIVWQYPPLAPLSARSAVEPLAWPRDADRLDNGNTLITDSNHNRVIEVTPAGQVAWQYASLDHPYDADRLTNGNTLISGSPGGGVIEVSSAGTSVWAYPPAPIDIELRSFSTLSPTGTLAVRIQAPAAGQARYAEGAPVVIWVPGGYEGRDLAHGLPPEADDLIVITFLFPGTTDPFAGRHSDGTYDYRGPNCILALRDVILYAAGERLDTLGRSIDQVLPVPVLHDNIGLIGVSNGGNIIVAAPALHGAELAGHLRYLVQWETPVSSQIATRDLGRVWLEPPDHPEQGDFRNLRYVAYGPLTLAVTYNDLAYDPAGSYYKVFHDGNGDGHYTTIEDPHNHLQTPDLNLDGVLTVTEDFPLAPYSDTHKLYYSRPVAQALAARHVLTPTWPANIGTPAESNAYWDIREAVRLYGQALANVPGLEGMVLASVRDHVQSMPNKPHIRQAFDGWRSAGGWVQINPSPTYLMEVDPSLSGRTDLPDNVPNTLPANWSSPVSYCIPEDIHDSIYQLAAVRQMADRAHAASTLTPPGGELITYVNSPGIGRIAVRLRLPVQPRYPEGAPIVLNVVTFFTPHTGFGVPHNQLDVTNVGAIAAACLWPGESDPLTGAASDGTYDHGGPDCLAALRDALRFVSGLMPNAEGRYIHQLLAVTPLTNTVGLYAFSHPGIVATNVLAYHGSALPNVKFFVGRENPTVPALSSMEVGYWGPQHQPVLNPYYIYPDDYLPTALSVDYSTLGWVQNGQYPAGRPFFDVPLGQDHILGENVPTMWGKRYYSQELTRALLDNGALTHATWPTDVATITDTLSHWPYRTTVQNYVTLTTTAPGLKVMLVFAKDDHVQPALDKPQIHQAYDGFRTTANLWVRMNPDRAYIHWIGPSLPDGQFPDNAANTQPADWLGVRQWGYPSVTNANELVPLAAVAEMADRVHENNWSANLTDVLVSYVPFQATPTPSPTRTATPTPTVWPTETPTATPSVTPRPTRTPTREQRLCVPLILRP